MPKAASERATTQRAVASERLEGLSDARYPIYNLVRLPKLIVEAA